MQKVEGVKLHEVTSVYDGDTFRATIKGLPRWVGENVPFRIAKIDTPEKGWRAKTTTEKALGQQARELVLNTFTSSKKLTVNIHGRDKYGRILCDVFADEQNVAELLIEAGLARFYDGGKKTAWG